MAASDARPIPIKNTAFRAVFPILDADGDLVTGATGLDSEVSKDQGTFADCTNEATEIATSSGMYYLDLTSTEMNADCVAVIVKTTSSGAKTTVLVFYPEETGDINVDVTAYGGTAGTFSGGRPEVNTTHAAGTAWGSGAITAASIANGAIDAATFAADVDAEILSYIVDDATRIDASALNTASVTTIPGINTKIGTPADLDTGATLAANTSDIYSSLSSVSALEATLSGYTFMQTGAVGATGNDTTHVHIDGAVGGDDELNDLMVEVLDAAGTGLWYARWISDYVSATELATLHEALPFTPASGDGDEWRIRLVRQDVTGGSGLDAAGVRAAIGLAAANLDTQLTAIDDYLDTEVGALTTELAKVPKSDSNVSWNATALAAIQSEANDALVANKLDHLVAVADADDPVDNSIVAKLASKSATADWSSYVNTTDSLEANRDNIGTAGAGLTAADDAVVTLLGTPAGASVSADILTLDNLVDDLESRLGTPSDLGSGATVAANLVDIEGQTDDIGVAGAGLTALATAAELAKVPKSDSNVSWNATALAAIQTEANDAIVANRLDELLAADSDIDGAQPPTVGSVYHELMSKTAGSFTFDQTTDSLEAVRDKLTDIETDTAEIGAAGAGLTEAGGTGDQLTAVPWNAAWDAEVQSEATDALNAYDPPTKAEMDAAIAAGDDAVLAAIAALENLSASGAANAVGALVIEGAVTLIQSLRLANAANAGKVAGAATSTVTLRNLADSIDRITATVDADGNRTAVTTDLS